MRADKRFLRNLTGGLRLVTFLPVDDRYFAPSLRQAVLLGGLAGLGFYMLHNTLQMNATQMAPEARGVAVSLFASFLFIGQTVGSAGLAGVFDRTHGAPIFAGAAVVLPLLAFWFAHKLKHHSA